MIKHRFCGQTIVTVALDFVAEGPDHLRMAEITALADIDVAARQFERRVGPHALHFFNGVLQPKKWCDFHNAAYGDHKQRKYQKQCNVALDLGVEGKGWVSI